jgi:hypothetical protein
VVPGRYPPGYPVPAYRAADAVKSTKDLVPLIFRSLTSGFLREEMEKRIDKLKRQGNLLKVLNIIGYVVKIYELAWSYAGGPLGGVVAYGLDKAWEAFMKSQTPSGGLELVIPFSPQIRRWWLTTQIRPGYEICRLPPEWAGKRHMNEYAWLPPGHPGYMSVEQLARALTEGGLPTKPEWLGPDPRTPTYGKE